MIKVAAASLNQVPLDWSWNIKNIQDAITNAKNEKAKILVLPELAVTGYGCEDAFFMEGISQECLSQISNLKIPSNMIVAIGLPLMVNNRLYNAIAVCHSQFSDFSDTTPRIAGFVLKQNLAKNGIHYESRWFNAWEAGKSCTINIPLQFSVPVGDLVFEVDGIRLGFEICEDAWVAARPGRSLFDRGVDIIINPSASHFAIGKHKIREQFVQEGSRAFGAAYIYCNMNGCESGRAIFDGGNMIASGGQIVARGSRLHFANSDLICANIDPQDNRITQTMSSQRVDSGTINTDIIDINLDFSSTNQNVASTVFNQKNMPEHQAWQFSPDIEHEEACRAIALGLRDWVTKTGTSGYALSLSGGADSGLVASLIYLMHLYEMVEQDGIIPDLSLIKEKMNGFLVSVYQGSDNSGEVTLNAAQKLMDEIGGDFFNWSISELVEGYINRVNKIGSRDLNWEQDDISLQNIQARVRSPGIWLVANRDNKLLLTTGNLSESSVGYMTMDGDTSGVLAPISGVSKVRILKILSWLYHTGTMVSNEQHIKIESLINIIAQQPTAELRPDKQSDEDDLMPFDVLDSIRRQVLLLRRRPATILINLQSEFIQHERAQLTAWIKRFYALFSRNQWKRDRMAAGFHIEAESMDSRTFSRFPILNSGLIKELKEL